MSFRRSGSNRSSVMATDPQSLANIYQDQEETAKCFAHVVYNVIMLGKDFRLEDFDDYELTLCEAFCLLWQNAETGEVSGRKMGLPLKISVFAAMFFDLVAAKRIKVYKEAGDDEPMIRVIDTSPTDTFLDEAVFNHIRTSAVHGKLHDAKLWKFLERADDQQCVGSTFDSLVEKGILEEQKRGILGIFKLFPTLDPEPEKLLEEKIQNIAFRKEKPDSFMLALLILSRESDRIFMCSDPILRKHFTPSEYVQAKKNMDKILLTYLNLN